MATTLNREDVSRDEQGYFDRYPKIVDISDDCRSGSRCVLLYTKSVRGLIAVIQRPYSGKRIMGALLSCLVNNVAIADGKCLRQWLNELGINFDQFQHLVKINAPTI